MIYYWPGIYIHVYGLEIASNAQCVMLHMAKLIPQLTIRVTIMPHLLFLKKSSYLTHLLEIMGVNRKHAPTNWEKNFDLLFQEAENKIVNYVPYVEKYFVM